MAKEIESPFTEVKSDLGDKDNVVETPPATKSENNNVENNDIKSIRGDVAKLCNEVEKWQMESKETLSALTEQLTESQNLIRQLSEREPIRETVAIAPTPEPQPQAAVSLNDVVDQGDQKTAQPKQAAKRRRLL